VRDIVVGLDGYLYIITSNRDGRAIPSGVDDQLIRIDPDQLQDAS
jgi:glucose/arabinose dehydrogenase